MSFSSTLRRFALGASLIAAAPALAQTAAPAATPDAAATAPAAAPTTAAPLFASTGSLFGDPVARRSGDVLTVVLAERTSAQRQSSYDASSGAGMGGAAAGSDSTMGRFGFDARFASDATARNETALADLLRGTVSVVVIGTDAAGNLQIEGERRISVNGVGHRLGVRGLVRPSDVSADNTVLSFQIANAEVVYRKEGRLSRFGPGFLPYVGAAVVALAAFFIGS
ncbi:MAG TPA: flagellar basal body L-ring protein FlgH [Rhodothermales bacterium]|nr:flagellar basal body L-ring protein FlgH [Rhodothermales bacterium]